jgi:hypothetical protein
VQSVRDAILSDLENLSAEHVGVLEEGVKIIVDATAAATKSHEGYQAFLDDTRRDMTMAWLGTSDATGPGENGSRGATETRTGAMLDPRMVSDGLALGASLQRTLFSSLLACNAHLFPVPVERIPVPVYRYITDDDETRPDQGVQIPIDDLLKLTDAVRGGRLALETAHQMMLLAYPQVTQEQIEKLLPKQADPTAPAPSAAPQVSLQ